MKFKTVNLTILFMASTLATTLPQQRLSAMESANQGNSTGGYVGNRFTILTPHDDSDCSSSASTSPQAPNLQNQLQSHDEPTSPKTQNSDTSEHDADLVVDFSAMHVSGAGTGIQDDDGEDVMPTEKYDEEDFSAFTSHVNRNTVSAGKNTSSSGGVAQVTSTTDDPFGFAPITPRSIANQADTTVAPRLPDLFESLNQQNQSPAHDSDEGDAVNHNQGGEAPADSTDDLAMQMARLDIAVENIVAQLGGGNHTSQQHHSQTSSTARSISEELEGGDDTGMMTSMAVEDGPEQQALQHAASHSSIGIDPGSGAEHEKKQTLSILVNESSTAAAADDDDTDNDADNDEEGGAFDDGAQQPAHEHERHDLEVVQNHEGNAGVQRGDEVKAPEGNGKQEEENLAGNLGEPSPAHLGMIKTLASTLSSEWKKRHHQLATTPAKGVSIQGRNDAPFANLVTQLTALMGIDDVDEFWAEFEAVMIKLSTKTADSEIQDDASDAAIAFFDGMLKPWEDAKDAEELRRPSTPDGGTSPRTPVAVAPPLPGHSTAGSDAAIAQSMSDINARRPHSNGPSGHVGLNPFNPLGCPIIFDGEGDVRRGGNVRPWQQNIKLFIQKRTEQVSSVPLPPALNDAELDQVVVQAVDEALEAANHHSHHSRNGSSVSNASAGGGQGGDGDDLGQEDDEEEEEEIPEVDAVLKKLITQWIEELTPGADKQDSVNLDAMARTAQELLESLDDEDAVLWANPGAEFGPRLKQNGLTDQGAHKIIGALNQKHRHDHAQDTAITARGGLSRNSCPGDGGQFGAGPGSTTGQQQLPTAGTMGTTATAATAALTVQGNNSRNGRTNHRWRWLCGGCK